MGEQAWMAVFALLPMAQDARAMVPADLPMFAGLSSNMATVLLARFEHTGRLTDLDDAVTAARHAVQGTPPGHPDRPLHLSNLAAALRFRFVRFGATEDLSEAHDRRGNPSLPARLRIRVACL
ncbi:hypothetical protein EAO69_30230 [Streptomyces sp. me109]|uniref:hypothetical protein n=1 Tax=Streptomyces sp. me109 TaxID=1827853 RepID=UPI0011CDF8F5|nr:hypothetical protein [Streptomyces sp. me109]TXS66103.1 hypothetical protein EAO69_30230 [Streptomyces sp. me109]